MPLYLSFPENTEDGDRENCLEKGRKSSISNKETANEEKDRQSFDESKKIELMSENLVTRVDPFTDNNVDIGATVTLCENGRNIESSFSSNLNIHLPYLHHQHDVGFQQPRCKSYWIPLESLTSTSCLVLSAAISHLYERFSRCIGLC